MANYQTLKAAINAVIKANGNKEITGTVLNETLLAIVNSLGVGYQFVGVATPSTNPGTPDQNVFYIAGKAGTYTNFNNIALHDGVSILKWNGSWSSETVVAGDDVFDISAYKATGGTLATFADLSAALDGGNNIPQSLRKGGMSVKFVQSSDNKYVQARCMAQNFTTDVTQWQGVDDEPTAGSDNLVKSGGVNKALNENLNENNLVISKIINITHIGDVDATECKADIELSAGEYEININPISAVFSSEVRLHLLYEGQTIPAAYLNTTNPVGGKIRVKSNRNIISVGYSGTISTAGSVEIYVKSLKKTDREIEVSQKGLFYLPQILVNGTIDASGIVTLYRPLSRISSINSYVADDAIEVNVASGHRYVLHYYNQDGSFKNSEGWFTTSKIIEAGSRWGITIGTVSDSVYESPDDIENSISLNHVNDSTRILCSVNGQGSTGVLTDFKIGKKRLLKFSIPGEWSITNVGAGDNNVITVGYKIGSNRIDIFQRTKQRLISGGFPKEFFIELPSFDIDGFYIFLRADTGVVANVFYEYYNYGSLNVPTTYQGQRIDIDPKYAVSVLSRMNDYGTPSVGINAQGMAVYNERYIIQGSNKVGVGSHFIIIDMQGKTLNTITYETLQSGQGFHMNNINLAGKYQDTDILPLAYCSECYNDKSCKVVRFSNTFNSFTIIQTIKYSGTTLQVQNYMDWVLDYENNMIYAFKDSNNGLDLYGFNLPSLENSDIVLGDADIVKTIRIPNTSGKNMLTQGGTIINGRLWTAFGSDTVNYPGFMAISDLNLQQMVSIVNLSGLGECESVCPYKQGILLCCASGGLNASSLANPAYVYMIFNV